MSPKKLDLYVVEDTGSAIQNDEVETIVLDADVQAARMSFGDYKMTGDGLVFDGDAIAGPFEILGRARDPQGDDWARWIRFKDADGRQHQVAIKDADLHGDPRTLAATLAGQGLWISPRQRPQLIQYFNNLEVEERVTFVARTGWHTIGDRRVFVLPSEAFGAAELVLLNTDAASPYAYSGALLIGRTASADSLPASGLVSLRYQRHSLVRSCTSPVKMVVAFTFAGRAQLARHHWRVRPPVFGVRVTYVRSWRATANGLEGAAVLATDTLLVLDELGVIDSRELHAAAYQLAIGHGKGRARRDGSMRMPSTWRVMVVSTGEVSIASKVEEDRNRRARAGQEVRILDIPTDAGKGYGAFDRPRAGEDSASGLADEIVRSAETHFGVAGPAFLQAIIAADIDKITDSLNASIEAFCAHVVKFGSDGQIRRAARRLALIAVAGELAREFGIVPWQKGEAIKAAEFALEQWITGRGGGEAAEVIQAIRSVRLFIEKYGDSRFENADVPESKIIIPSRAGWRRGAGKDQIWLVLPETWRSEVCAGLDPAHVAKVLAAREMLERATDGYLKQHWIGGRNLRAYTITARIFMSEEALDTLDTLEADKTCTSENDPTSQNTANTKGLTPLTPLTPQTHTEGVCKADGTEPVCAQCGAPDDLGSYQNGTGTVWLHEVCAPFWRDSFWKKPGDDLGLPDFLDRRGQS